jgi:hypothetical protein
MEEIINKIIEKGTYTVIESEWSGKHEKGRPVKAEYNLNGQIVVREIVYIENVDSNLMFATKSINTYLK